MTSNGDNFFGPAKAKILGGEGSGATATPTVQTVTGLSLLNSGRSYQSAPTLIFEGGGGQGARGSAKIDQNGKVTNSFLQILVNFIKSTIYFINWWWRYWCKSSCYY